MEQRLERIENMVGQLITMVGNVLTEQQQMRKRMDKFEAELAEMRKDIERLSSDMQVVKDQLTDVTKSIDFLVHKTGEHDKEIYILKHK